MTKKGWIILGISIAVGIPILCVGIYMLRKVLVFGAVFLFAFLVANREIPEEISYYAPEEAVVYMEDLMEEHEEEIFELGNMYFKEKKEPHMMIYIPDNDIVYAFWGAHESETERVTKENTDPEVYEKIVEVSNAMGELPIQFIDKRDFDKPQFTIYIYTNKEEYFRATAVYEANIELSKLHNPEYKYFTEDTVDAFYYDKYDNGAWFRDKDGNVLYKP